MDQQGLQPADAGLLFTASALTICAGQPLMRWSRLDTLSAPVAFVAGYLLLASGLGGYALAHDLADYLAATVVWSVGDLLLVGRVYAVVARLAPASAKGRYLAVYGTSWGIAGITAPLLGTQLLEHAGPAGLWSAMALACLLLAVLQPALVRYVTSRGDGDDQRRSAPAERT